MVDEGRARNLLRRIAQDVELLRARSRMDRAELVADVDRLAAVKYMFVTAIEGCVDVAHHICASESWAPPPTNAAADRRGGGDVIPSPARPFGTVCPTIVGELRTATLENGKVDDYDAGS